MLYIRTTKTGSGTTAVQVVRYENRKMIVAAHIGSSHSRAEVLSLRQTATQWIRRSSRQPSLFPENEKSASRLLSLDKCKYLGIRYSFVYETLSQLFVLFKFHLFNNSLLTDLVLIRIIEPASKLRSLKLLEEYFGIKHSPNNLYRQLKGFAGLKDQAEDKILAVAKKHFHFDFSLVFYDVTTLYFESFESDELRKCGFSKDNKANQPQVLIGLIVNVDGFPASYEIFAGNKFEGHTLIPIIDAFRRKHKIGRLTVVADAAMLSFDNMQTLNDSELKYIVGARLNNVSGNLREAIDKSLPRTDGTTIRLPGPRGDLICGFSAARFRKDKHEMEKQIRKAKAAITNPGKLKRMKFLKSVRASKYELNDELIKKSQTFLGVKGYYTNLPENVNNQMIIQHYHNLWQLEQAFRLAKSDLEIRPIYHFKQQTIKAHILICFMALAVSKYLEIKTGKSLKHIIQELKGVTDARILNMITKQQAILRSEIRPEIKDLLQQLRV